MTSKYIRFLIAAAIFCIVSVCLYLDVLISKDSLPEFQNDIIYQYIHYRFLLITDLLARYALSFWNPCVFCGTPFQANIQMTIFYPPTAFILPISTSLGITSRLVLHHILGGLCAYLLCRSFSISLPGSLIGGIIYSFFPGIFRSEIFLGGLSLPQTIAWIPLVFWSFRKSMDTGDIRYSILSGCVVTVQNPGGTPEIALGSHVGLLCFAIIYILHLFAAQAYSDMKKRAACLVLAYALDFALPAIQILPTLEFDSLSNRAGSVQKQNSQMSYRSDSPALRRRTERNDRRRSQRNTGIV